MSNVYFSVRQVMQQQHQQDLLTSNHYSTLGRASGPGTMLALGMCLYLCRKLEQYQISERFKCKIFIF